jgi:HlyD family secretion protein
LKLDATQARAALAIVTGGLDELTARRARLEAERDGADNLVFPSELPPRSADSELDRITSGERKLFDVRRASRTAQTSQLRERIAQLRDEIRGAEAQAATKAHEIDLITQELGGVRDLWRKKLVPFSRVTALERDGARLEGERAALIASVAQLKDRIAETEIQILQVDQDIRSDVGKELAEIRAKISELVERRVSAEDQLKHVEIRAPQDGKVHQLSVHTVGGVVSPGETIMLIVPDADDLVVEARILPQDIDKVRMEQPATLRFDAFNQRTTPQINGWVSRISPDLSQDKVTGQSFYLIRVSMTKKEVARLVGHKLVPGMPVETFVRTGDRSIVSYLLKPMLDQAAKAFRES